MVRGYANEITAMNEPGAAKYGCEGSSGIAYVAYIGQKIVVADRVSEYFDNQFAVDVASSNKPGAVIIARRGGRWCIAY